MPAVAGMGTGGREPRPGGVARGGREELCDLLAEVGVVLLADVRRYPVSRRHPQFTRAALESDLPSRGMRYEWWGQALGGRRAPATGGPGGSRHPAWDDDAFRGCAEHMDGAEFREAFGRLLSAAAAAPTAVMCAETLWMRCHRRLLSDAAELAGTPVVHLLAPGHAERHRLHPALRRGDDDWPVYDLGVQTPLT